MANETISTALDLHARLVSIAQKAVNQVQANQRPNDFVIPDSQGTPVPPPVSQGK